MTNEQKAWIDNASYKQLLARWRFSKVGDEMFQGDVGQYYTKVLAAKRDADPAGHVAASKSIGW